jgi:hypothetical protein
MSSSEMLRRVALVRTDVSEELRASMIKVTRIGELGTLAVTSNRRTIRRNTDDGALSSSETSVLTRATRHNIPEDAIQHSHRRENLKSYLVTSIAALSTFNGHDRFLISISILKCSLFVGTHISKTEITKVYGLSRAASLIVR